MALLGAAALTAIASRARKDAAVLGMQLLTAVLTHHVRDAFRRGLWLWPLVNDSVPVSYTAYIAFEALWPALLALAWLRYRPAQARLKSGVQVQA